MSLGDTTSLNFDKGALRGMNGVHFFGNGGGGGLDGSAPQTLYFVVDDVAVYQMDIVDGHWIPTIDCPDCNPNGQTEGVLELDVYSGVPGVTIHAVTSVRLFFLSTLFFLFA